jgi:sarcosine oxidase gamma subunit
LDVVSVYAASPACDAVMSEASACRIAPDEVMLIGKPGTAKGTVGRVADVVGAHAVVIDATDGWSAWTLEGDDARRAFSYLSHLDLPEEGFVQGEVALLPAKVVTDGAGVHIFVPSMLEHDLRRRILARCGHLGLVEVAW